MEDAIAKCYMEVQTFLSFRKPDKLAVLFKPLLEAFTTVMAFGQFFFDPPEDAQIVLEVWKSQCEFLLALWLTRIFCPRRED